MRDLRGQLHCNPDARSVQKLILAYVLARLLAPIALLTMRRREPHHTQRIKATLEGPTRLAA